MNRKVRLHRLYLTIIFYVYYLIGVILDEEVVSGSSSDARSSNIFAQGSFSVGLFRKCKFCIERIN